MQPIWSPFTSWTHTFRLTLAIFIRLPGHSPARLSILGAKTHLSNGSSLGKIRPQSRLTPNLVLFISSLPVVTLNINIRGPWIPQANLFLFSHRILPIRKPSSLCSVYLQQTSSLQPTMGTFIAWQFRPLRIGGQMTSSTRTHTREYISPPEVETSPSRLVISLSHCA